MNSRADNVWGLMHNTEAAEFRKDEPCRMEVDEERLLPSSSFILHPSSFILPGLVGERSMGIEAVVEAAVDRMEVRMPARVTKSRVRIPAAESLRVLKEGSSS
jgi:hypothetical protein